MIGCLRVRRTESGPGVLSGGLPDAEHASSPALGRTCEGRLEIREHRLRRRGVERPPEERAAGRRRGSELDEHELMALIREGEQDRRGELLAPQLESAKGGQHRHPRQHGRVAGLEAPPGLDEAWRKEQRRHRLRDRREVLCGDRLLGCRFACSAIAAKKSSSTSSIGGRAVTRRPMLVPTKRNGEDLEAGSFRDLGLRHP